VRAGTLEGDLRVGHGVREDAASEEEPLAHSEPHAQLERHGRAFGFALPVPEEADLHVVLKPAAAEPHADLRACVLRRAVRRLLSQRGRGQRDRAHQGDTCEHT
jgi:hypothetical protein